MYSIMIVDDDAFFASVFEGNYDWNASGFSFEAYAGSGSAAIEILHKQHIDLVFVDMCMPGMNGPELIQYITANFPDVQCVALSNYDDFDFVKASFRFGAQDYVLKHCLNRQEMHRLLSDFLKRRGEIGDVASRRDVPDAESDDQRIGRFLTALLDGTFIQDHGDYRLWDAMGLPHLSENLLVVRTDIEGFDGFRRKYYELSKLKYILRSICSILRNMLEHLADGVVFYSESDGCFYSILCGDSLKDPQMHDQIRSMYISQVASAMKMYFNVGCVSRAAPLVRDVRDIRYAYRELMHGEGHQTREEAELPVTVDFDGIRIHALDALRRSLKSPSFEDARRYIARCYADGRRLGYRQEHYVQLTMVLYRILLILNEETPGDDFKCPEPAFIDRAPQEMEQFISGAFSELYEKTRDGAAIARSGFVQDALNAIRQNYAMPTLSLNVIAETIHVSPSHLSRCFKAEIGMGISEYINRFRVERAQTLFAVDQPNVKTVAAHCGFESYNYFFRIFKRYTGLTPKEFCARHNLDFSGPEGEDPTP